MAGRNILITGGSSGIGTAAVLRFARGGDRVWFTYRLGGKAAEALVGQLAAEGFDEVTAVEFDQADWDSHVALVERLPERIDVLVNNAAVGSATVDRYAEGAGHLRDAAFLQINTIGPLWLVRTLAPGMVERGYGKIVNISSVGGGITQFPQFDVADGMSKAALAYMTRHLAAQWAHLPVDVFALCPGAVETAMFEASTLDRLPAGERRRLESGLPGGRLIQPEEIGELIWWLCGDAAVVMRGAVIDASLGLGSDPAQLSRTHEHDDWAGAAR